MDKFVLYIGEGVFEQGVPARDLTADEWDAVPLEVKKRLLNQKIYKLVKQSAPAKKESE